MIRDVYFIVASSGQCKYHKSYSRTPVDEALVSGFFTAMGSLITSMPEGQIKSVPAGNYKFTVTASNYKDAEKVMKLAVDSALKGFNEKTGEAKFTRDDQ